jgi:hypothetical protein
MGTVNLTLTGTDIDDALNKAKNPYTGGFINQPSVSDAEKIPTAYATWAGLNSITVDNFADAAIVTSNDTILSNKNDTTIPTSLAVYNHLRGFVSSELTIPTDNSLITVAHGLGETPSELSIDFKCVSANPSDGFTTGEIRTGTRLGVHADATNVYYRRGSAGNISFIPIGVTPPINSDSYEIITYSEWRIILRARV